MVVEDVPTETEPSAQPSIEAVVKPADDDDDDSPPDMDIFEMEADESEPAVVTKPIRDYKYKITGGQRAPKDALKEFVQQHLKTTPKVSFDAHKGCHQFKITVRFANDAPGISITPDEICASQKEGHELATVLALFTLARREGLLNRQVHKNLPVPFRNRWLDWLDEEKAEGVRRVREEARPRIEFVEGLLAQHSKELKKDAEEEEVVVVDAPARAFSDVGSDDDDWENEIVKMPDTSVLSTAAPSDKYDDDGIERDAPEYGCQYRPRKGGAPPDVLLNSLAQHRLKLGDNYYDIQEQRAGLPVTQQKNEILDMIKNHSVSIVSGATGSGKTTQVPQFVLESLLENSQDCDIVVTEPRRISAVSVAKRVAHEMGTQSPGSKDGLVGYHVRLDRKAGPNTRLLYCTTGVLLRIMQADTSLSRVSHVFIDEVHERAADTDMLLLFVRRLVQTRPDIKVVLMSATMDAQKFQAYFGKARLDVPYASVPGRTFPVKTFYLEDAVQHCGYIIEEDSEFAKRKEYNWQHAQVNISQLGGKSKKEDLTWGSGNKIIKLNLITIGGPAPARGSPVRFAQAKHCAA